MLLTLEPHLLESLRETLRNMPPGSTLEYFYLNGEPPFIHADTEHWCLDPPTQEALLATAIELAQIMGSIESLKSLTLKQATAAMTSAFLTACSQLESVELKSCPLVTASVRSLFSINSLRQLEIHYCDFEDSEAVDAFCLGMEASSVEELKL